MLKRPPNCLCNVRIELESFCYLGKMYDFFSLTETADQEPVFIQPLSNVMARVGQKLKLECVVTGRPELKLTWKQNNRPILNPDIQVTYFYI